MVQQAPDPDPHSVDDDQPAVTDDGQPGERGEARDRTDAVDPAAGVNPPTDDTADPAIEEFAERGMGVAAKE